MDLRTSRLRLVRHLGYIVLAAASCRDSAGPGGSTEIVTTLAPASPTVLAGTVGTPVADVPSVTVRDASGRPVAGVVVTFSVTSGGGTLQATRVVSSTAGIASVGRWTLGASPGMNGMAATNASGDTVVFTADAVAGPPFYLEKVGGDGQTALPGATLGVRPRVMVTDAYHNRLPGVTVTFDVLAGGGSVSRAVAVSDSAGIAESGDWVLGTLGVQRMVARAGQLTSDPFTAMAVVPPFTCAPSGGLLKENTIQGALTPLSCTGADGRSLDAYTIVVTEQNGYVFTMASAEFDTYLELRGPGLTPLARNDDRNPTTNSGFKVLLPPGTYTLAASSSKPGAIGSYSLSYRLANSDAEGCEEAFIVRGITARGVVTEGDCVLQPNEFSDRFRIYLDAGSRVEIRVEDFSYSFPTVQIVGPDGSSAIAYAGGGYVTKLGFEAPVDGYYTVLVGLLNETGVQYEITVR
jgi:hypothetical protein